MISFSHALCKRTKTHAKSSLLWKLMKKKCQVKSVFYVRLVFLAGGILKISFSGILVCLACLYFSIERRKKHTFLSLYSDANWISVIWEIIYIKFGREFTIYQSEVTKKNGIGKNTESSLYVRMNYKLILKIYKLLSVFLPVPI